MGHRARALPAVLALSLAWTTAAASRGIDEAVERELGQLVREAMRYQYGFVEDPLLLGWLDRVGQQVARLVPRQDYPYAFHLLDIDSVNAFSAPGCYIFVTKGLLETAASDDELAAVLAHELGHASERHGWRLIERELMVTAAGYAVGPYLDDKILLGLQLWHVFETLGYSRHLENRADRFAAEWTYRAGYDPHGLIAFFRRIQPDREPARWMEYLQTHPMVSERIRTVAGYPWLSDDNVAVTLHTADGLRRGLRLRPALAAYRKVVELMPGNDDARAAVQSIEALWHPEGDQRPSPTLVAQTDDRGEAVRRLRLAAAEVSQRQQLLGEPFDQFAKRVRGVERLRAQALMLDELSYSNPRIDDWHWWAIIAQTRHAIWSLDRALYRATATRTGVRGSLAELRRLADDAARAAEQGRLEPAEADALAGELDRQAAGTADELSAGLERVAGALGSISSGLQLLQIALADVFDPFSFEPRRLSTVNFAALEAAVSAARHQATTALAACSGGYDSTVAGRLRVVGLRLRLAAGESRNGGREVYRQVVAYRSRCRPEVVRELDSQGLRVDEVAWAVSLAGSAAMDPLDVVRVRRPGESWAELAQRLGADRDAVRLSLEMLRRHLEDALPQ